MHSKNLHGFETYTIASADQGTQASFVPARGGVAYSLIMQGNAGARELLYCHDYFWDREIDDLPGGWPFCFPVCARLERQGREGEYLYDGKIYTLPIHGFAWNKPWNLIHIDDASLIVVLQDDAETLSQFPFSFKVTLHYRVAKNVLICEQTYENRGANAMPYNAGFHPYFLTPLPGQGKEQVRLHYHPIRHFQYNDHLTDIVGELPLFELPTSISNPKINEQLTRVAQQKQMDLIYPDGDRLHLLAEGIEDPDLFPYVQLYTMENKPFFCAEPWMGFPNAMNSVQGMRWLQPGQVEHGILKLWLD
jgi:galactose mutarotase-like enzyme